MARRLASALGRARWGGTRTSRRRRAPSPRPPRRPGTDATPRPSAGGSALRRAGRDRTRRRGARDASPPAPPTTSATSATPGGPSKSYYFVGLRYRGTVIPQVHHRTSSSTAAATSTRTRSALELDIARTTRSRHPGLTSTDYGTRQHALPPEDRSRRHRQLVDRQQQPEGHLPRRRHPLVGAVAQQLDFEYGLGFGLGVVFGALHRQLGLRDRQPEGHVTRTAIRRALNGTSQATRAVHRSLHTGMRSRKAAAARPGQLQHRRALQGRQDRKLRRAARVQRPRADRSSSTSAFRSVGVRIKPIKSVRGARASASLTGFFGISGTTGPRSGHSSPPPTPQHATQAGARDAAVADPKKDS